MQPLRPVERFRREILRSMSSGRAFWRLGAALRCKRGGDDCLARVHVGNGRDADARRLDDVDGVDADARTDVARRRGDVPGHVDRDDGGDDAAVPGPDAFAISPGRWQVRPEAPRSADRARGPELLLHLDRVRNGRFPLGVAVLMAGTFQFTAWKAHHLACCREAPGRDHTLPADASTAWRHGLHCSHCCADLMAISWSSGSWTFARWLSWRQPSQFRRQLFAAAAFPWYRQGPEASGYQGVPALGLASN
jgi:Predicted metal-binding integral membrane protein (DUF2182)